MTGTADPVSFEAADVVPDPGDGCPTCGGFEATELGTLGRLYWVRCRLCGTDYHLDPA